MIIETKFKVWDEVWLLHSSSVKTWIIFRLDIRVTDNVKTISYNLKFHWKDEHNRVEHCLFKTKEDLINSL